QRAVAGVEPLVDDALELGLALHDERRRGLVPRGLNPLLRLVDGLPESLNGLPRLREVGAGRREDTPGLNPHVGRRERGLARLLLVARNARHQPLPMRLAW